MTPQKPHLAVSTLRDTEAAGITSDGDMNQQLVIELAGGDSFSEVPFPDVPLPNARPECLVGEELTRPGIGEEAMVVAFGLGSGSCLVRFLCFNLFFSGIDYYTRREVFGSLKVYFIYAFCTAFMFIGFSLFTV